LTHSQLQTQATKAELNRLKQNLQNIESRIAFESSKKSSDMHDSDNKLQMLKKLQKLKGEFESLILLWDDFDIPKDCKTTVSPSQTSLIFDKEKYVQS